MVLPGRRDGPAAHDGLEANYGLNKPFTEATWADLAGHKYLGRYTILRVQELASCCASTPDMYVILDSKYARLDIYKRMLRHAPERSLRERIFPTSRTGPSGEHRTVYPVQNYVLALYRTQARTATTTLSWPTSLSRYRAPAVMMWWRTEPLAQPGRQRPPGPPLPPLDASALKGVGANVYVHSLGDPNQIQRFGTGVGVYSDEPFPPSVGPQHCNRSRKRH